MHMYDEIYNYHLVKDGETVGASLYTSSLAEIRDDDSQPGYHVAFVVEGYSEEDPASGHPGVIEITRHTTREVPRSEWAAKSAA